MTGTSKANAVGDHRVDAEIEIKVDVTGRWDALALSELLVPFHSYLVQHTTDRWVVHARSPGGHGESLAEALGAIDEWRAERGLDAPARVELDWRRKREAPRSRTQRRMQKA
jgi:hypothetical protein